MFRLGKLEFEVESASFHGGFEDAAISRRMTSGGAANLHWFIDIDLKEGDFVYELSEEELAGLQEGEEYIYESVLPRLYHNNGFTLDAASWKELEGIILKWDSPYNEKGEEAGSLYVFEHEDVTKGTIEFLRREGRKYYIRWSGTANVFWNDEYGADVPFVFEGEVDFGGIIACCDEISSLEELIPAMQQFVNMDEFECVEKERYGKGRWKFMPKNID